MIQRARNGRTMGFGGTNGSFGMAGQTAAMPGDVVVHYPHGASVDEKGRVAIPGNIRASLEKNSPIKEIVVGRHLRHPCLMARDIAYDEELHDRISHRCEML